MAGRRVVRVSVAAYLLAAAPLIPLHLAFHPAPMGRSGAGVGAPHLAAVAGAEAARPAPRATEGRPSCLARAGAGSRTSTATLRGGVAGSVAGATCDFCCLIGQGVPAAAARIVLAPPATSRTPAALEPARRAWLLRSLSARAPPSALL